MFLFVEMGWFRKQQFLTSNGRFMFGYVVFYPLRGLSNICQSTGTFDEVDYEVRVTRVEALNRVFMTSMGMEKGFAFDDR